MNARQWQQVFDAGSAELDNPLVAEPADVLRRALDAMARKCAELAEPPGTVSYNPATHMPVCSAGLEITTMTYGAGARYMHGARQCEHGGPLDLVPREVPQ